MVKERIVSAAIYWGGIISLPPPARHSDILATMQETMHISYIIPNTLQGFLTDKGRYVNRVEAFGIAYRACQFLDSPKGPELYSEDLW